MKYYGIVAGRKYNDIHSRITLYGELLEVYIYDHFNNCVRCISIPQLFNGSCIIDIGNFVYYDESVNELYKINEIDNEEEFKHYELLKSFVNVKELDKTIYDYLLDRIKDCFLVLKDFYFRIDIMEYYDRVVLVMEDFKKNSIPLNGDIMQSISCLINFPDSIDLIVESIAELECEVEAIEDFNL